MPPGESAGRKRARLRGLACRAVVSVPKPWLTFQEWGQITVRDPDVKEVPRSASVMIAGNILPLLLVLFKIQRFDSPDFDSGNP